MVLFDWMPWIETTWLEGTCSIRENGWWRVLCTPKIKWVQLCDWRRRDHRPLGPGAKGSIMYVGLFNGKDDASVLEPSEKAGTWRGSESGDAMEADFDKGDKTVRTKRGADLQDYRKFIAIKWKMALFQLVRFQYMTNEWCSGVLQDTSLHPK